MTKTRTCRYRSTSWRDRERAQTLLRQVRLVTDSKKMAALIAAAAKQKKARNSFEWIQYEKDVCGDVCSI
jgi:spore germination protein YaaH